MNNSIAITWAYIPLVIWFILSIIWLFIRKKNPLVIGSIPSGFATSGVLGTFIGIAIGLKGFDVEDISSSIPILLLGLKQAFYTSILGIILSMIFAKIIEFNFEKEVEEVDTATKELREVVRLLHESNSINTNIANQMPKESLFQLLQTIESNMKKGVETVVSALNDNNEKLAQKLAEMNSRELLSAMEQSVMIFNKKMESILQRLIQENFAELNNTVQRLNDWQLENMENMELLIKENTSVSNHLRDTSSILENSFSEIVSHVHNLTNEEGRLQKIVTELESITLGENQFRIIMEQAEKSTNKLSKTMDQFDDVLSLTKEINNKIYATNQSMVVVTNELKQLAALKDLNGKYWKSLEKGNRILNESLDDIDEQFKINLSRTLESLDKLIKGYLVEQRN